MSLTLIAFDDQPNRFAATKVGNTVQDGQFFLDFTRKLEVIRWFGIRNRYIGFATGLFVPVVHVAEKSGGYVIAVSVGESYFQDIRRLWKTHFPSIPAIVSQEADGLKIASDFATQFPES
jgi:hypothetical protein